MFSRAAPDRPRSSSIASNRAESGSSGVVARASLDDEESMSIGSETLITLIRFVCGIGGDIARGGGGEEGVEGVDVEGVGSDMMMVVVELLRALPKFTTAGGPTRSPRVRARPRSGDWCQHCIIDQRL